MRHVRGAPAVAVAAFAAVVLADGGRSWADLSPITWRLDNLERIAGHPVRIVGAPRLVSSDLGPVVEFNGRTDGLVLETNPLAGLAQFTVEVIFQPAADGPEEQRFVHMEERGTGNRALIELRMAPGGRWALDTYLRTGDTGLTLLDRGRTHPAAEWHAAALSYDGTTMTHYVNGVRELAGAIRFPALGPGATSIGVRQNLVSWFKGRIHSVRVSPEALPPARHLTAPRKAEGVRRKVEG